MKSKCEKTRSLSAFLDGDLPAHEAARVAEHLARCSECRAAADQFDTSIAALRAILEAEGRATHDHSLAPSVIDRLRSKNSSTVRAGRWVIAIAAAALLIVVLIGDIKVKPRGAGPGETGSLEPSTGLMVKVRPDRFDVEDRMGGTVRTVNVRP